MGYSKRSCKREIHRDKCLHHKTIKSSNKQPNFIPQGTRKEEQMKPEVSRWKEITKIRELNEYKLKRKDQ